MGNCNGKTTSLILDLFYSTFNTLTDIILQFTWSAKILNTFLDYVNRSFYQRENNRFYGYYVTKTKLKKVTIPI